MLLKSIKLENFRQFRNCYLNFASGENGKNVTIIVGDNASGKTTFAQAFTWCMYGDTSFSDKVILNKHVAVNMTPLDKEKVSVTLELRHGSIDYTIKRVQVYRKNSSNKVKGENALFTIEKKDSSGKTSWVPSSHSEAEIQSILPKQLSRYFFFDGERIKNMSDEISNGKKSDEFAEAVSSLLGLNALKAAKDHFDPKYSTSVIRSYEKSFDSSSNAKVKSYSERIERDNTRINEIEKKFEILDSQERAAQARLKEQSVEIKQYEDGAKLQNEKERLEKQIKNAEIVRANVYKEICRDFNNSMSCFFSLSMIARALQLLSRHKFTGKDIPDIRDRTINYLLNRGTCICGTHLDEGSVPYNNLKSLLDVIPPKSLSTYISEFKKESKIRTDKYVDLVNLTKENLATISRQTDNITDYSDEIRKIEDKLTGKDVRSKVRAIQNEIRICENTINRCGQDRNNLNRELGSLERDVKLLDAARQRLTLQDEQNRKTQIYLTYARRIFEDLNKEYTENETRIRNRLQNTINDIYKQIYKGGLSLNVDQRYHITVQSDEYIGDVEASTAQNIAVIFAFIAGIIRMAKENRTSTDVNAKLLSSEPYPLVMDAPLSTFDDERIGTISKTLPQIAEQIVIFIKNTDGEKAAQYMEGRIGVRHTFKKIDEFETELI